MSILVHRLNRNDLNNYVVVNIASYIFHSPINLSQLLTQLLNLTFDVGVCIEYPMFIIIQNCHVSIKI